MSSDNIANFIAFSELAAVLKGNSLTSENLANVKVQDPIGFELCAVKCPLTAPCITYDEIRIDVKMKVAKAYTWASLYGTAFELDSDNEPRCFMGKHWDMAQDRHRYSTPIYGKSNSKWGTPEGIPAIETDKNGISNIVTTRGSQQYLADKAIADGIIKFPSQYRFPLDYNRFYWELDHCPVAQIPYNTYQGLNRGFDGKVVLDKAGNPSWTKLSGGIRWCDGVISDGSTFKFKFTVARFNGADARGKDYTIFDENFMKAELLGG